MKIKATARWEPERDETVSSYTERCLDGYSYENGQLETISDGVRKNASAIGRLLETLAEKGLLTAPEIVKIVEGYNNDEAKLIS